MDDILEKLELGANALCVELSAQQKHHLMEYMELLLKWNKTYNLTALKTKQQVLVHHILDSLSVVKPLRQLFELDQTIRVLDVGSGGGLPGVVLAIMNPTWLIECIDAVEKKTSFITMVAGILKLSNLKSNHVRIEDYDIEPVDIVISRAFASLADFANLAGKHVASNGVLVAMKGHYLEEEVQELREKTSWQIEKYIPISVPQLEAERCLIYLQHVKED